MIGAGGIVLSKLMAKVEKLPCEAGCWLWTGTVHEKTSTGQRAGYGFIKIGGLLRSAHRLMWEAVRGPISKGLMVLHRCDVRCCVRPDHLFLGTHADNMADMARKGRQASGDRNGARLWPDRHPRGLGHYSHTAPEKLVRGERQWLAKLTDAGVREMRALRAAGHTFGFIAGQFGVTKATAHRAIIGRSWRHVVAALVLSWAGSVNAGEPPSSIMVSVGMGISVSDATDKYPEAGVTADFPLAAGVRGGAALELTGLPGQSRVNPSDPATFKAAGARVSLAVALADHAAYGVDAQGQTVRYVQQRIAIEVAGGTWTRLVTRDVEPRDRFVSEGTVGVRVERRSLAGEVERYLSLRVGHSGIAGSPDQWVPAVVMEGRARVLSIRGAGLDIGARVDKAMWGSQTGRDRFAVSVRGAW